MKEQLPHSEIERIIDEQERELDSLLQAAGVDASAAEGADRRADAADAAGRAAGWWQRLVRRVKQRL